MCVPIDLEFGFRIFPLVESFIGKGSSHESKKCFHQELCSRMFEGGIPFISIIKAIYSYSVSPANRGKPL